MRAILDTRQLHRAAAAVLPHVAKEKEDERTALSLVQITVTEDLAWVQATNGKTAAAASVDVVRAEGLTGDPAEDSVQLSAPALGVILSGIRPATDILDESAASFEWEPGAGGDGFVTVTDVSGLVPGQRLQIGIAERDPMYPNVARAAMGVLEARPLSAVDPEKGPVGKVRFVDLVARMKLFAAAERQYHEKALIQGVQGSTTLLVTCTERFVGAIATWVPGEDRTEWHRDLTEEQDTLADQLGPLARALQASKNTTSTVRSAS